jgi:predicted DNA-binding transcriptional regulator AlpA
VKNVLSTLIYRMGKKRPSRYLSVSEVARRLDVTAETLFYHISKGAIPPPVVRFGNSMYYLPGDVNGIREFVRKRRPARTSRWTAEDVKRMRELWESGLRQSQIADEYGTTQPVISSLLVGRTRVIGAERSNWQPRRRNNG